MDAPIGSNSVSFWDELPVPDANIAVYKQVYALEQWLRRVAYAALMAKYGSGWRGSLDPSLTKDLRRRLRQLSDRVYLDCENSDNVIWLLTLDELQSLLLENANWPTVKELTGLPRRVLESKLREIREIRNVIGHNRAIGGKAELLMTAATSALEAGIDSFKTQLLYSEPLEVHVGHPEDYEEDTVPARFAEMTAGNDWSVFQPMLSESNYFYALTRLPCGPYEQFLGIKRFLDRLAPIRQEILAVFVNKMGVEFTVVWPRQSAWDAHKRVMNFFFKNHDAAWISTPYLGQSPAALCDPAIWFYENQRPERP